jgi:hypothetical protein
MKKMMKLMMALFAVAMVAMSALAQQPNKVTGTIGIVYSTRTQLDNSGSPLPDVKDVYTLDLSVTDTLIFGGKIEYLPTILGGLIGSEKQAGKLGYDIQLSVRNPANLSQIKGVGKFIGAVPLDKNGVYQYGNGNLRIAIESAGTASQSQSSFRGQAAGKPPKDSSMLAKATKEAVSITRKVGGKDVKILVTDYDKMSFNGLVLAAGPAISAYPETTVNGEMLYDYERDVWFFRNVVMSYQINGKSEVDKLSGNIKWIESPNRATNGEGEYQFDVRVDEPAVDAGAEAAFFASAGDESSFFAEDLSLPALVGTAKYKDTIGSDETVTASQVTIDLTGNNLNKAQIVNLTKLIWLVSVVPMNAE